MHQIAGDDLKQFSGNSQPSDETIADSSIRFRRMAEDIRKFLDPQVIQVDVEAVEPNPGREHINMSAAMFPIL